LRKGLKCNTTEKAFLTGQKLLLRKVVKVKFWGLNFVRFRSIFDRLPCAERRDEYCCVELATPHDKRFLPLPLPPRAEVLNLYELFVKQD